ncbi:transmembrane protein 174 isoform X2 [Eleginops maclovinus]|uniref:transmembrane protein 174 isoform X2 n=1 Tax=Eleginops maclovinus TaxID=56733 RepID=UPI00307FF3E2
MFQRPVMETSQVRNPALSDSLKYNEKSGVFLLFSGVFLGLAGLTFTTMGWYHYRENSKFGWTQLLGPVLISMGGTFMLTSFCRFGIVSCWPCRQLDEGVRVMPAMDQTSIAPSIIAAEFQSGGCVNGVHAARPPHAAVYCVDNAAFTAEEEEMDHRRSRINRR